MSDDRRPPPSGKGPGKNPPEKAGQRSIPTSSGPRSRPSPFLNKKPVDMVPDEFVGDEEISQAGLLYFKLLQKTANDLVKDEFGQEYEVAQHEVEREESTIHPFLEKSGALRVQVPLPSDMEELYILATIVLGGKGNRDSYRLTREGLKDKAFPAPLVLFQVCQYRRKRYSKRFNDLG